MLPAKGEELPSGDSSPLVVWEIRTWGKVENREVFAGGNEREKPWASYNHS